MKDITHGPCYSNFRPIFGTIVEGLMAGEPNFAGVTSDGNMVDRRDQLASASHRMARLARRMLETGSGPYSGLRLSRRECHAVGTDLQLILSASGVTVADLPQRAIEPAVSESGLERAARAVAAMLGDDFDHAFESKSEWIDARGIKGGRFRDLHEPRQTDYLDLARAVAVAIDSRSSDDRLDADAQATARPSNGT